MTIKNMAIETKKGRFNNTTTFTIEFVKHIDNPNWLSDENVPMYRTETVEETHKFDDKMSYRIQRFFKYEFQKTDAIILNFNTIKLDEFKKIVEDVVPDNHPTGLYLDGHTVYILNEHMAKTHDASVLTFKKVMEYLEKEFWMHLCI